MGTRRLSKMVVCAGVVMAVLGPAHAAIVGVGDVTVEGTRLVSLTTADGYTVTVGQLVTGTTTAPSGWNVDNPPEMADNFNFSTATSNGYPLTTVDFGGRNWVDTNGDLPDFFLFESGGNDGGDIQAIFPDGTLGLPLRFTTANWASTGIPGLWTNQIIHGLAFAVTDLRDADGNPLTNSTIIKGLRFSNTGVDPTTIAAIAPPPMLQAYAPSPADGTIGLTLALFQWTAGDTAILHSVYLGTNPELTEADLQSAGQSGTQFFHHLPLTPGATYFWRVDEIEGDGVTVHTGKVWSFLVQDVKAYYPGPQDGETDVPLAPTLTWMPGSAVVQHHVYFGDSLDAVSQGAGTDQGLLDHKVTAFAPGDLESLRTYYWRVDEVAIGNEVRPGNVWAFSTYLAVDDFESYTDEEGTNSRIYETWLDGAANQSGALVGYWDPPFAEQTIVHGGRQSMPLDYNNVNAPYYSETVREFSPERDWTIDDAGMLVLSVCGRANNKPAPLYVMLEDAARQTAMVSYPDEAVVKAATWTEWRVPLSDFAGVNAARIKKMYIGVGDKNAQAPGGFGLLYLDDIRLTRAPASN